MIDYGDFCTECLAPFTSVEVRRPASGFRSLLAWPLTLVRKGDFGPGAEYTRGPSCECAENGAAAIWKKNGSGVARGQIFAANHWCRAALYALSELERSLPPHPERDGNVLADTKQALADAIFHTSRMSLLLRCECAKCVVKSVTGHIPGLPIAEVADRDALDVIAGEQAHITQELANSWGDVRTCVEAGDRAAALIALGRMGDLIRSKRDIETQALARLCKGSVSH